MRTKFSALLLLVTTVAAKHHLHPRVPIIDLHGEDSFVGSVREDENIVSVSPAIQIVSETGPICKYELGSASNLTIPFDVQVINQNTGEALIREGFAIDCKQKTFNLTLTAIRCGEDGVKSEALPLRVTVKDTNNHAPEFEQPWYTFSVEEGKVVKFIAQLSATDDDCGHPFGEICEYEITNGLEKFPFTISNEGILSNTRALNYSQAKSYILTVVAHDCGLRRSKNALVTINVKEACVEGLSNMPERVSYTPGSGAKTLFPDAQVQFCVPAAECEVASVRADVELHLAHVSGGCSRRDVFSNDSIRGCGLSASHIDLLSTTSRLGTVRDEEDNGGEDSDDSSSSYEESSETSSSEAIVFDGLTNALIVSKKSVPEVIPDKFSLSFTMKHQKGSKKDDANKQMILCETDESGLDRHHFAVFVRRCKLEVVLRRETGERTDFRPAEWRWRTPEVCDGQWHSYTLLFNGLDDVNLLIDGKGFRFGLCSVRQFRRDERNPEILDDWPLKQRKDANTKLVVGACWRGKEHEMGQFFKGSIAHMHLLLNQVESEEALACAHRCPEQLSFSGSDELRDGESAQVGPEEASVGLNASTTAALSRMLQRVAYVNSRAQPLEGHRQLAVAPRVRCANGKDIELPAVRAYLFVQRRAAPELSVSGDGLVAAEQNALKDGVQMLPGVKLTVSQAGPDGEVSEVTGAYKLDFCHVHLKPSRDMDLEYFSSPASVIAGMKINFEHDKEGILLYGEESIQSYLAVLSQIRYFNTRPESYTKRIYSVQCGMLKGAVKSNEFVVTMSVRPSEAPLPTDPTAFDPPLDAIEKRISPAPIPSHKKQKLLKRHFEPSLDQLGGSRLQNILEMDLPRPKALLSHHGYDMGQGAVAGGAVAVVVVVCVGFLLVLLVIGVLKMRDTPVPRRHNRRQKKSEAGMQWDDEGMNITVNPLEDVEKSGGADAFSDEDEEEDSEAESECSFRDDEEMSEDEDGEAEVLPHADARGVQNGLEWDDETIATTRSYRV